MTRLLSVLLVLAGLGLVAPPAHAAVSATINASATTVRDGSTVTFTGRAVEARLGSVVRLQHRRLDGSWAVVASKKLVETRRYSFTTTPPRGYQRYRVVMPRQLGHPYAASPALTIQVTWHPGVTLGSVSHQVVDWATGAVVTSTLGATKDLAGGTELRREVRRADGSWALHGRVRTTADQTWRDSFASSHGQRFRYLAPAAGARLATASTVFAVDGRWTPTISASALLDPLTEIATATGDATGLSQGSTLQLQFRSGDQWYAEGSRVAVGADGSFSPPALAGRLRRRRSRSVKRHLLGSS